MAERHSEFTRDANDWYVEESWNVERLLARIDFPGRALHDPCCGMGTIVKAAQNNGFNATGADLIDRGFGYRVQNFLADRGPYPSVVFNPPFKHSEAMVAHALRIVPHGGVVAAICQGKFLFSQGRHPLWTRPEAERVIVFSRRPNMPPGPMLLEQGEGCRGGGAIDYVWGVWRVGKTAPGAVIEWTL